MSTKDEASVFLCIDGGKKRVSEQPLRSLHVFASMLRFED